MVGTKYPISLSNLSRITGLAPTHISKILNGRSAREETIIRLAGALGLSVEEFRRQYPQKQRHPVAA